MNLLPFRRRYSKPELSCAMALRLQGIRDTGSLGPTEGHALVVHLDEPCPDCRTQLGRLPTLAEPEGRLADSPEIVETRHPVVLALRTLGGWPPESWLSPSRSEARQRVDEPFGFLRLVLEEARVWAIHDLDGFVELGRWVEAVGRWPDPQRQPPPLLRARALTMMAEAFANQSNLDAGWELLRRSVEEAGAPENSDGIELAAFQAEVQARLSETTGPSHANDEYALAADYLVSPKHTERRLEIQLRQIRFLIRSAIRVEDREAPSLDQAARLLGEVQRRLQDRDGSRLLRQSYRQAAALLALRRAGTARPGLERRVHFAEALGHFTFARPLPRIVDPNLVREWELLERLVEEEHRAQEPENVRGALGSLDPADRVQSLVVLAAVEKSDDRRQELRTFLNEHPQGRDPLRVAALQLATVLDRFVGVPAVRRVLVSCLPVLAAEGIDI